MSDRTRAWISFDPPKHGWSNLHFRDNTGVEFSLSGFSYVFDPFEDFIRTAECALEGQQMKSASFFGEPMEWRWTVEKKEPAPEAMLSIEIVEYPDFRFQRRLGEVGKSLFQYDCDAQAYARAVLKAMSPLRDLGVNFESEWRRPFPEHSYTWLAHAVST